MSHRPPDQSASPAPDRSNAAAPAAHDGDASHAVGPVGGLMLLVRSVVGGWLMGLANVVPGVSGGTMLLASGIYPNFIEAVAEISTLRFRKRSLLVLILVASFALLAIALAARFIRPLILDHRWIMYSLFIGLTLGGVPILWRMIRPASPTTWVAAFFGLIAMTLLAIAQAAGWGAGEGESANWWLLFAAGVAGASAMILPGVSGAYLLLVLGAYLPILTAIDTLRTAVGERDVENIIHPAMVVVLPVGLGVVVGVVLVSNLVRVLLVRFRAATLGSLLGLLVGAVVGLWPFQQPVEPRQGDVVRGQVMTVDRIAALDPEKYPTEFFTPSIMQVLIALALIALGFAITATLARLSPRTSTT